MSQQSRPVGFLTDREVFVATEAHGKPSEALRVEGARAMREVRRKVEGDLRSTAKGRRNRIRAAFL